MKRSAANKIRWTFAAVVVVTLTALLGACDYPSPDYSKWNMTQDERDSLRFFAEHHYTTNYNFEVAGDSLALRADITGDTLYIYKHDKLVVADIEVKSTEAGDSVWVKVARDQETMGWITEHDFLPYVTPVNPISLFIHLFSDIHVVVFLVVLVLFLLSFLLYRIRRRHIALRTYRVYSVYSVVLSMLVSCSAALYASMQLFIPETWRHFYYNPSLNPFVLPLVLACFIAAVWAMVLVFIAAVDELYHKTTLPDLLFRVVGLCAFCLFLYLFFTITISVYVGYPCLVAFLYCALRYLCRVNDRYTCGNCGREIHSKGTCPYCGAINR